ncbi:MAG: ParA family protein [Puniceicoccaceae bacterium]
MKILSLYNLKGGVGKTTAAVNLAHAAAGEGFRALLCDFDPQGSSSFFLRAESADTMKTGKLLKGKSFAHKQVRPTEFMNLDVLPAHLAFRDLDRTIDREKKSSTALRSLFKGFRDDYDLLVADAPAGITLFSENLFHLSDLVLVPTIPTTLSTNCLDQLTDFFRDHKIPRSRLRAFFSQVDRRKRLHREIVENEPSRAGEKTYLGTSVPSASIVERMGEHRRPVAAFGRTSAAAKSFSSLWSEIRRLLDLN